MQVLVLGGSGFIGRHVAAALLERGHRAVIGTRDPASAGRRLPAALLACERREAHLDWLTAAAGWHSLLKNIDCVVNAVGILRQRGFATHERVHYRAPRALADACGRKSLRLVHISLLGLSDMSRGLYLRSRLAGERAIAASSADWSIVRPSVLDGAGGSRAAWLRRAARWPVHLVPADAKGRIASLDVGDLGDAIAALCERSGAHGWREVELGGGAQRTLAEHLAALRLAQGLNAAPVLTVPSPLVRFAGLICDLMHLSPLSCGTLELMHRDNAPRLNLLPALLGRTPLPVGRQPQAVEVAATGQEIPVPPNPQ